MSDRVDASVVIASFTGWDEIAIEQHFRMSFAKMGESTMALRAVEFVMQRRDGVSDGPAFKASMDVPFGELSARYAEGLEGVEDSGEADGSD